MYFKRRVAFIALAIAVFVGFKVYSAPTSKYIDMNADQYIQALNEERNKIDQIDQEILTLLDKRGRHSIAIGQLKSSKGVKIVDDAREQLVIERLARQSKIYNEQAIALIWSAIFTSSKELQK